MRTTTRTWALLAAIAASGAGCVAQDVELSNLAADEGEQPPVATASFAIGRTFWAVPHTVALRVAEEFHRVAGRGDQRSALVEAHNLLMANVRNPQWRAENVIEQDIDVLSADLGNAIATGEAQEIGFGLASVTRKGIVPGHSVRIGLQTTDFEGEASVLVARVKFPRSLIPAVKAIRYKLTPIEQSWVRLVEAATKDKGVSGLLPWVGTQAAGEGPPAALMRFHVRASKNSYDLTTPDVDGFLRQGLQAGVLQLLLRTASVDPNTPSLVQTEWGTSGRPENNSLSLLFNPLVSPPAGHKSRRPPRRR